MKRFHFLFILDLSPFLNVFSQNDRNIVQSTDADGLIKKNQNFPSINQLKYNIIIKTVASINKYKRRYESRTEQMMDE